MRIILLSLNKPSHWYTSEAGDTIYEGSFGENVDGFVNAAGKSALNTKVAGDASDVTFGNLTYQVTAARDNINLLQIGGNRKLTIKNDFTFYYEISDPWVEGTSYNPDSSFQCLKFRDKTSLSVGGNFIVDAYHYAKDPADYKELLFAFRNDAYNDSTKAEIAGHLIVSGTNIQFMNMLPTLNVGGVLSLDGNIFSYGSTYQHSSSEVKLGGLGNLDGSMGTGVLAHLAKTKEDNVINTSLTFTNSAKYDFKGTFLALDDDTDININMNATDAKNGRQILRFETKEDSSHYVGHSNFGGGIAQETQRIDNLNVIAGRLDLAMHEFMNVRNFKLDGTDAVFSATGLRINSEIGMLSMETVELVKGKLVFDCSSTENDSIVITSDYQTTENENAGKLIISNPSDVTFALNLSDDLISEAEASEMLELVLISFESTNITASDIANINVESNSDLYVTLKGVFSDDVLTGINAIVSTVAVPEPATVASLLGLFALAVAIIRRRK